MSNMFDSGGNIIACGEQGVHDDPKTFNLEIGLVWGFKEATVVKVVVEGYSEMGVSDGGDKCGMFHGGGE